MVEKGLTPNVVTYTTLVDGLCKRGEVDIANELLLEMSEKGLQPNVCTYIALINGLCKVGNIEQAIKIMEEMDLTGFYPDTITYTLWTLIGCSKMIYKRMYAQGVMPDNNTYNILIKGHCKARNRKEAWFLHNEMVEERFSLTVASYDALIKGFCKRKFVQAKKLFEMKLKALL
ncbi:pentatricopeptide repeat-containing protein At1g05670, mitochondrial-like [Vigna umbellata]|uniref:pentatricopeptide repeat-containing protein At1g05670, mitochondrial-like n=1 Tax=Vigna umbellata TaxID=87088 RepID=UPI001F5E35E6|nr:pentatricopeptide repeat-containing protein At1g05670, mitochondrial-like [Vigna umbellata]